MDTLNFLVDLPELSLANVALSENSSSFPAKRPSPPRGSPWREPVPPPPIERDCLIYNQEEDARNLDLQSENMVARVPLSEGEKPDTCFLVHEFVSANEMAHLLAMSLPHMESVDRLFSEEDRRSDRALLRAPKLARELFDRLAPHLSPEDYAGRIPLCFGHGGVWVPVGLNECIKVVRYEQNGHFALHRDGPWIPREDQASLFTLVVYLNENFCGGRTEMWPSRGICSGLRDHLFGGGDFSRLITPVAGTALVFNHDCWHASTPVKDGIKYILRTEVVFQRVHSFYLDKHWFSSTEEYTACRQLYEQSQRAIRDGRREEFVVMYQRVVQYQRDAMLREAEKAHAPTLPLNLDCFAITLSFLTDGDLMTLIRCSRGTFCAVLSSPMWEARFRSLGLLLPSAVFGDTYQLLLHSKRSFLQTTYYFDWAALYIHHRRMRRQFIPWVLMVSGGSCSLLVATRRTILPYSMAGRTVDSSSRWPQPVVIGEVPFHAFSIPGFYVEWRALFAPVDQIVDSTAHPMLLVGHPEWFPNVPNGKDSPKGARQTSPLREQLAAVFEVFRTPAVLLCHPASLIAAAHLRSPPATDGVSGLLCVLHFFACLIDDPTGITPPVEPPLCFQDAMQVYISLVDPKTLEVKETHILGAGLDKTVSLPYILSRPTGESEKSGSGDSGTLSVAKTVLFPEWKLRGQEQGVSPEMVLRYLRGGEKAVQISWAAQAEAACALGLSPTFRERCYFRWS